MMLLETMASEKLSDFPSLGSADTTAQPKRLKDINQNIATETVKVVSASEVNLMDILKPPETDMDSMQGFNDATIKKDSTSELTSDKCKFTKLVGFPILKSVLDTRQPVDTVIVCSDGRIGAHRIVLAAVSPFLGFLFEDQKLGEVAVILLPDISRKTMEILMHLAYTGQMLFPKEVEDDVFAAMDLLLFGQEADLKLSKVWVKGPEPLPVSNPVPSTSGASRSSETSSTSSVSRSNKLTTNEKRKRTVRDNLGSKKKWKKQKLDEYGKQVPVAYRTGTPIGKAGAFRLRKRAQKRYIRDGLGICPPAKFKSDPTTNVVSLSLRKLPCVSIRLKPIEDFVCIEVNKKKGSPWTNYPPYSPTNATSSKTSLGGETGNNQMNTNYKEMEDVKKDPPSIFQPPPHFPQTSVIVESNNDLEDDDDEDSLLTFPTLMETSSLHNDVQQDDTRDM